MSGTGHAVGTVEREFKFEVPEGFRMPPLDDLDGERTVRVVDHTATYYDTPDLRLARAGASLRYRDDDGWTVKLPASSREGLLTRSEFLFGGSPATPPSEAVELVAALARTARLVPVARIHTTRRRVDLPGLGTLTDDVSTVVGGPGSRTFRELELELVDDAAADLVDDVVARLEAAGATATDPIPKVVRVLGPDAARPPDVLPHRVGHPPTVAGVIRHALSDAVAKLVAHDPVVRVGEDPEGVHQARVATRRLRSHLRTFRSLLDPGWSEPLREEVAWLGAELGAVRDADVLLARLQDHLDALEAEDRGALEPLLQRLVDQRDAARQVLLDGLRSRRYLELLDRLVDAAHRPRVVMRVGADDDETLRAIVRRPWRRLRRAVAALPEPPPDAALHDVRIRAKRARYAAEVVEPAFGRPARDLARALTRVQDVLGAHQDAVVAASWLRSNALTLDDPRAIFAAGELAAVERAAARAARAEWPRAWRRAARHGMRAWR